MHKVYAIKEKGYTKQQIKAMQKATKDLQLEIYKQTKIVFCAATVVMWRYGWRDKRILNRFEEAQKVWNEVAEDVSMSMLCKLEEETGIEMSIGGYEKSYHDIEFLRRNANVRTPDFGKYMFMRKAQMKWIAPQILAAFMIVMHRRDRWGYEKLIKLLTDMDAIRREYGDDLDKYVNLMEEETDFAFQDIKKAIEDI